MKRYDFGALDNLRVATVGAPFWVGVGIIGLAFALLAITNNTTYHGLLVIMGTLVIIYGIVQFFIKAKKVETANAEAFQQFATANALTFTPKEVYGHEVGSLFNEGHSQKVSNVLRGQSHGLAFKLFNFEYTIGHGKQSHTYRLSALAVELPHKMPQLVIDSLIEEGSGRTSTLPITFDSSQKIQLEGDFSQFFDVYAPKNHGIDALTILAPDVMRTLLQQGAICDIEIIDNRIYFYWPLYSEKRAAYEKIFTVFETIMAQIAPPIMRMDDALAVQKVMPNASTSPSMLRAESPGKWIIASIVGLVLYSMITQFVNGQAMDESMGTLVQFLSIFIWGGVLFGALYYGFRRRKLRKRLQQRYGKNSKP